MHTCVCVCVTFMGGADRRGDACLCLCSKVAPGVFKYVPSPVDKEVKVGVIRDTLRLMDPGHKKASM